MRERDDIDYELVIGDAGSVTLTCGGEVMWTSDADDDFAEDFPDTIIEFDDEGEIDEVIGWLIEEGYLPPGADVSVVEDDSATTGRFEALDENL